MTRRLSRATKEGLAQLQCNGAVTREQFEAGQIAEFCARVDQGESFSLSFRDHTGGSHPRYFLNEQEVSQAVGSAVLCYCLESSRAPSAEVLSHGCIAAIIAAIHTVDGTVQDMRDALSALHRMAATEIVSVQDLRMHLAAALPGAYRLAATALGVDMRELTRLLEEGQVRSGVLLPALAQALWGFVQAHAPGLHGYLCEACLDAPATQLQAAPWGEEMGVCAACAGQGQTLHG